MLSWFHALLPREERFFDLFAKHSQAVVAGAEDLRRMFEGGEAIARHYQGVMDHEQEADDVTRDVLIAVRRTFITPFDRGNIKDLITSMDNAIDQMQKTAKTIMLFDVRTFTPDMKRMADTIVQSAGLVRDAIPLLRSINTEVLRLTHITEEISHLEGRADEMHDVGLKELYQTHIRGNAMEFFASAEVYDHLEKVVDRFDDVANVLHGIVIEHV